MATHSSDGLSGAILFSSDRTFRVWRYGVGHSQLLLRAVPDDVNPRCLDLLFEGVTAINLVTRYESIDIRLALENQAEEMLDFSGLTSPWREQIITVAIRSGNRSGFVLCKTARALDGGIDPVDGGEVFDGHNVIWSIRR